MAQLDGLRAIAVSMVFIDHWVGERYHLGIMWGDLGVKLFYVLSGFLITGILLEIRPVVGRQLLRGARQFYIRRFLRIFPLFYLTLFLAALAGFPGVRETFWWHVSYLSNFYIASISAWPSFISHFWSLAVEEQFYLSWAWLILFIPHRGLLPVLVTLLVLGPISRFAGVILGGNPISIYVLPVSSFDVLGIGALLAYLSRFGASHRISVDKLARISLVVGAATFIGIEILERTVSRTPVVEALHLTIKPVAIGGVYGWLVLRASVGLKGIAGTLLTARPIAHMGKVSYGLYMFNPFMPSVAGWFLAPVGLLPLMDIAPLRLAVLLAATVGLASLSWRFFEGPINDLKRHFPYK